MKGWQDLTFAASLIVYSIRRLQHGELFLKFVIGRSDFRCRVTNSSFELSRPIPGPYKSAMVDTSGALTNQAHELIQAIDGLVRGIFRTDGSPDVRRKVATYLAEANYQAFLEKSKGDRRGWFSDVISVSEKFLAGIDQILEKSSDDFDFQERVLEFQNEIIDAVDKFEVWQKENSILQFEHSVFGPTGVSAEQQIFNNTEDPIKPDLRAERRNLFMGMALREYRLLNLQKISPDKLDHVDQTFVDLISQMGRNSGFYIWLEPLQTSQLRKVLRATSTLMETAVWTVEIGRPSKTTKHLILRKAEGIELRFQTLIDPAQLLALIKRL